ncbi:superoxide dismutase [Pseudonocardia sp. EC080610-09]|uniref:superoxide dismutase family protein n=1 Tax=unclassified Pseudonocardia TaxID=2619320 RepID=UPI0006CB00CF|nr:MULTISPECIES: superoxide dismutase family protein [unclassified Pseudonocardia]ALE75222.1 superoxide dismutase [Pseudonocardia sp. EC080625-04]ALL74587.1 superoxide dismutase [Pseudonocardia sp. EC080610-09]ALL81607.1 superoxide dismutase [Pseudonocardia sp. EC080619-01]
MNVRTSARVALLGATALLVVACGGGGQTGQGDAAAVEQNVQVSATTAEGGDGPAYTYDTALVPAGATLEVSSGNDGGSTTTTLRVSGLVPNRAYGSHAHTMPCGPDAGDAAGPHYQLSQDPVTPSVDPAYANPQNEIWLDFTTDAEGNAEATSTVPWTFPDDRRAASVVVHEEPTATHAGHAGTAGGRPACVTVEF